jgi:hypothetical protein
MERAWDASLSIVLAGQQPHIEARPLAAVFAAQVVPHHVGLEAFAGMSADKVRQCAAALMIA